MPKCATLWLALSLTICAGCSKTNSPSVPQPTPYAGIPAGLMERCTVQDIPLITAGDILKSRGIYIDAFRICAARIDAIRNHDAEARAIP